MLDPAPISFRRLTLADLPLMRRWLNTEHVMAWYGVGSAKGPSTLETVTAHYTPSISGQVPTDPFLILHEGRPIGYIQRYAIRDWPDYAAVVDVNEHAAGVDLFIGDPDVVHRGLGAHVLRRFLRDVVFADPASESCIIGPEPENRGAIRSYEKAGFRYLKTVQDPSGEVNYLMRLGRAEALGAEDERAALSG